MASKQLGKLRQWAGEVISSRDKITTVTDEFRELERDIELRRDGVQHLHLASEAYHHALSKKKDSEALDESEKLLPIDALGLTMLAHGEEYGEESAFGTSLIKFGRAHCKIATLQEAYALTFQDTFLASLQRTGEDIKDYEHQRKKLESRRLSYDAAMSKLDKIKGNKKVKEKDLKEAEEELQKARLRYEETSEDVRARMHAIQENEIQQLRELTNFLDLEINFAQQSLEVLKDVKNNWCDESSLKHVDLPRMNGLSHNFARGSVRSKRSSMSARSNPNETFTDDSEDEPEATRSTPTRKRPHRKSDSTATTKPPSRPSSRASRSDSTSTAAGEEKKEKTDKTGRRMSMAGWASSLTGRGKKEKENFAALKGDDGEASEDDHSEIQRPPSSRSFTNKKATKTKSKESLATSSPKTPIRILKPPSLQDKKLVRALYDFSGSSDELSFKAGDEIIVVNEVLDGWWMGELDGRKGLFPTPYIEVIPSSLSKPALPYRPGRGSLTSSGDDTSRRTLVEPDTDGYGTSDFDDDHPFGDHLLADSRGSTHGHFDAASITSSAAEEEEERKLMPNKLTADEDDDSTSPTHLTPPVIHRPTMTRLSIPDIGSSTTISGRKAPPPPPPRRSTNNLHSLSPPVPERRPTAMRSLSATSLPRGGRTPSPVTPVSSNSSGGYDASPFESTADFSGTVCREFKQNPFQPKGMCNNCFQYHG